MPQAAVDDAPALVRTHPGERLDAIRKRPGHQHGGALGDRRGEVERAGAVPFGGRDAGENRVAGLIGIALFSESLAIGLSVGGGKSSITFLPLLASVQLFGPVGGLALIVPTMAFVEFVVRRKSLMKGTFNVAQAVVGTTLGGMAFGLLGGEPLEGVQNPDIASQLIPFIGFGLVFLAINHAAVSFAVSLSQGLPFRRVWEQVLSNS